MKRIKRFIRLLTIGDGISYFKFGLVETVVLVIVASVQIYSVWQSIGWASMITFPGYALIIIGGNHIMYAYIVDAVRYKTRGYRMCILGLIYLLVCALVYLLLGLT